uniref:Uncharacterized protein n=1 Tax=Solanum tuberosum TaxID=4113 RepID=M1C4C4_SOLTU
MTNRPPCSVLSFYYAKGGHQGVNQMRKRSLLKLFPNYQKCFKIRADKMTSVYYYWKYLWSKCFCKLGTPVYFFL